MNVSEDMVHRSAAARAKAQGASIEDVLRAWGGGGEIVATSAGDAPAAPQQSSPSETPTPQSGPAVEVIGAADEAAVEEPADEESGDPEPLMESEQVAAAAGALPRWLAALFVVVPAFAIAYALFLPNGPNCGDSGRLAVDPISGVAVNCDGSVYGQDSVDFFAVGQEAYATCAACHGAGGGGAGSFPAFTGGAILATFPVGECDDHVEWVRLGTTGWPEPTYGANDTQVGASGAVMPGFGASLTEEQLRSVALFERVAFGGADLDEAIDDCGLGDDGEDSDDDDEAAALGS